MCTEGNKYNMPIWRKLNLTVEEAACYSNIGEKRIREELSSELCTFRLKVGKNKKLVKRAEFEIWINSLDEID